MARVSITLLGGFRLEEADVQPVRLPGATRLQSLLSYLILHREEPVPRRRLWGLLWPDTDEQRAAGNLRQLLHRMRKTWPESASYITAQRHQIGWSGPECDVDIEEFRRAASGPKTMLEHAVALYQGDLLPECDEPWTAPLRRDLQALYTDVLRRLLDQYCDSNDTSAAIRTGQELLVVEPFDEGLHLRVLQLHVQREDRRAIREAYEVYQHSVCNELGIAPDDAISALVTPWLRESHEAQEKSEMNTEELAVLDGLSTTNKAILKLIAIATQSHQDDISLDLLRSACDQRRQHAWNGPSSSSHTAILTCLFALLRADILEEREPRVYRLKHTSLREYCLRGLPQTERLALHTACAEAMTTQLAADTPTAQRAALAAHLAAIGQQERAVQEYLKSARTARAHFALDQARQYYECALSMTLEDGHDAFDAQAELLQEVMLLQGKDEEVTPMLEAITATAKRRGELHEEARVQILWGRYLHRQGDVDKAHTQLQSAIERITAAMSSGTCEPEDCQRVLLDAYLASGPLLSQQGDYDKAREQYGQALALARAADDFPSQGAALQGMATLCLEQSQHAEARALFEQSLEIYHQTNALRSEARVLNNLAVIHIERGEYTEALAITERSLLLRQELGDRAGEALATTNLGYIRLREEKLTMAQSLYEQALSMWRELGHSRGEGHALNNLGAIYRDLGQQQLALKTLSTSLILAQRIGDRRLEGYNALYRATCHRYLRHTREAARAISIADALFKELDATIERGYCACELALQTLANDPEAIIPDDRLSAIEELAKTQEVTANSMLGRMLARVKRANAARQRGEQLSYGQCPRDLPNAIHL